MIKDYSFEPSSEIKPLLKLTDIENEIAESIPFLKTNLKRLINYLEEEEKLQNFIEIDLPILDLSIVYKLNLFYKLNKGFFLLVYYVVIIFGLLGIGLAIIKKHKMGILISSLIIGHIFLHAIIMGYIENRYLAAIYPIFTIFAAYALNIILNKFNISLPLLNKFK